MGENYYLHYTELLFILSAIGMEEWYGIELNNTVDVFSTYNSKQILSKLYEKNIIRWEDGQIVFQPPFNELFKILKNADFCVVAEKDNGAESVAFYINDNGIVGMEVSNRDKHTFCVSILLKTQWVELLRKRGFFPENFLDLEYEREMPTKYLVFDNEVQSDKYRGPDVYVVMEKIEMGTKKVVERILVQDSGLEEYLYVLQAEKCECMLCNEETVAFALNNFIKLGDIG